MIRAFISFLYLLSLSVACAADKPNIVNVYAWHGSIPTSLIKAFEGKTGVKVIFDVIESNEVLEAKLLAGNTGYDVVFPTSWPYGVRQLKAGLFLKLDRTQLPNFKGIGSFYLEQMSAGDPGNLYLIPQTWGTSAIAYNADLIKSPVESWGMVFDPAVLAKYKSHGVALPDDMTDVFFCYYVYRGIDVADRTLKTLRKVRDELKERRHFYKKFSSSDSHEQLANGDLAVVMGWSGVLLKTQQKYKGMKGKPNIGLMLPREGSVIWVDCMAIPKDAPHASNAHKFINFLLEAKNAAVITNETWTATTIDGSKAFVRTEVKGNKILFPDATYMKKVKSAELHSKKYQRHLTRAFTAVVTHKK